jgi:hypothetical protein
LFFLLFVAMGIPDARIAGLASFWVLQRDTLQVPQARHPIYRVLWKIQALPMFGSYDFVTGINP